MFTAEQTTTRNPGIGTQKMYALIESIVLKVLKKFRFVEKGIVTDVDCASGRVQCSLPYQSNRLSKWMKVYCPFASNNEGIVAMPNVGDVGLVFFMLGSLNNGFFLHSTVFSTERPVPNTDEPLQPKDLVIKRNGSWFRIQPDSSVDIVHKKGNRARLSDGFVRLETPTVTHNVLQKDGETLLPEKVYGQKHVCQKYYVKQRRAGSEDPFEALAFSKMESRKQHSSVVYRRVIDQPEGDVKCWWCCVDQEAPSYLPPTSSKEEYLKEERIHRYADVGNTDDDMNILNYSRTTEVKKMPKYSDLAIDDGVIIEKNSEIAFHTWIGRRAFAYIALNVSEKNDKRFAGFRVQVMADGLVETFEVDATTGSQDDGSVLAAFEDAIKRASFSVEETDALPLPSGDEISEGQQFPDEAVNLIMPTSGSVDNMGEFGMRYHWYWKEIRMHNGIDIDAPEGTPVYAAGDGEVVSVGFDQNGYGNFIVIKHSDSFETLYGHLNDIVVDRGQAVIQGDLIGHVGNTGISSEPHLHFEVRYKGKPVNPRLFLP